MSPKESPHSTSPINNGSPLQSRTSYEDQSVGLANSRDGQAAPIENQHAVSYLSGWKLQAVNISICLGLFQANLELTIVSTALVSITDDLGQFQKANWVINAYLVAYAGIVMIVAKMSDIYGRKYVFLLVIAVFVVFSLAAGFAQSFTELIAFRAIQGLGGGGVQSMVWVILPEMIPKEKYPMYSGIVSSMFAVSCLLGPLLGGAIVQHTTWRWVFLLNGPIGAVIFFLILFFMPSNFPYLHTKPKSLRQVFSTAGLRRVDFVGTFLLLAASVLLVTALEDAGVENPWESAAILAPLVISILCWLAFGGWQRYGSSVNSIREQILPWRLMTNRYTMGTILYSFFCSVLYVVVVNLPQRFQVVNSLSPLDTGVRLLALTLSLPVGNIWTVLLIQKLRVPPFILMIAGGALQLLALGLLFSVSTDLAVPSALYGYEVILGIGVGATIGSVVLMATLIFEQRDMAAGMGAITQFRAIGASIQLAICTTVLNNRLSSALSTLNPPLPPGQISALLSNAASLSNLDPALQKTVREVFADGFRSQTYVLMSFTIAGIISTCALLWGMEVRYKGPAQAEVKEEAAAEKGGYAGTGTLDISDMKS